MNLRVTNNDWQTKPVAIKDATHRVLKNGVRIATVLKMQRMALKI